jgi:hypothetical protein
VTAQLSLSLVDAMDVEQLGSLSSLSPLAPLTALESLEIVVVESGAAAGGKSDGSLDESDADAATAVRPPRLAGPLPAFVSRLSGLAAVSFSNVALCDSDLHAFVPIAALRVRLVSSGSVRLLLY